MIQLSYSASQKYEMSPRSYYLHYMARLRPIKVGSPLVFGGSIDTGLNTLLYNKMNNENNCPYESFLKAWTKADINGVEVDLRKSDLVKYSKADYDESILTDSDKEAIEGGLNPNWVSLHRKGVMMIDAYKEQIMPRIQEVLAVQKNVKLTNENGDKFVGWIDFVCKWEDDKIYIVDNKTTSVKYKEDSVRTSPQLATYFEGDKLDTSYEAYGAMYIAIAKKFRKKKLPLVPIEVVTDIISEDLIHDTFEAYDASLHGIKMGNFPCTGCRDNVFGCTYKKFCDSDGEDMEGLEYVSKRKT